MIVGRVIRFDRSLLLMLVVGAGLLFSAACTTTPPLSHATNNVPFATTIPVRDIVQRVKCDLSAALYEKVYKGKNKKFSWMQNWTAKADLTLEVNETGGVSPSFLFTQPLPNAFAFGLGPSSINTATGAVTNTVSATAQNFSVGFGANYSGQVTRSETISFTVSLLELKDWKENRPMAIEGQEPSELYVCEPHGATDLQGGLDLKAWLDEALDPVERGYLAPGLHPDPAAKGAAATAGAQSKPGSSAAKATPDRFFPGPSPDDLLTPEEKARYDLKLTVALTQMGIPYLRPNQDPVDKQTVNCKDNNIPGAQLPPCTPKYVPRPIDPIRNCVTVNGTNIQLVPPPYAASSSSNTPSPSSKGSGSSSSPSSKGSASSSSLKDQAIAAAQSAISANDQAVVSNVLNASIKRRIAHAALEARRAAILVERSSYFAQQNILQACKSVVPTVIADPELTCQIPPPATQKGDSATNDNTTPSSPPSDDKALSLPTSDDKTSSYVAIQLDASYCYRTEYNNFINQFLSDYVTPAGYNETVATQNSNIATKLLTPDPPMEAIGQSINFIVTAGANASPSWSLLHWKGPGAASGGNLVSLSGIRTHTLNIALGQPTDAGAQEAERVLNNQAIRQAIETLQ